jgi:hypothetical protein
MSWGPNVPAEIEYCYLPYDHEMVKYMLVKMCEEAGVRLLLHAFLDHAIVRGQTLQGVDVLTKDGHRQLLTGVTVDATGDGDVAVSAGAEFQYGDEEGMPQNATLLFKVGGVDLDRALEALKNGNTPLQGWGEWHNKVKIGPRLGEKELSILGFQARVSARYGGEKDRERIIIMSINSYRKGEAFLNLTRTTNINPNNPEDLTRAEVEERKKAYEAVKAMREDKLPGFENAYVMWTSPQVGIREGRRIVGEYVLSAEDVIEGRIFADGIAKGAYPADIHDPKGGPHSFRFIKEGGSYDIPYRCLIPLRIDNLLIAGRAVSCDHIALGSVRLQATVGAIGHAAGTAAAMSVKQGIAPRHLNINTLRSTLVEQGAYLEAPLPVPPPTL